MSFNAAASWDKTHTDNVQYKQSSVSAKSSQKPVLIWIPHLAVEFSPKPPCLRAKFA